MRLIKVYLLPYIIKVRICSDPKDIVNAYLFDIKFY